MAFRPQSERSEASVRRPRPSGRGLPSDQIPFLGRAQRHQDRLVRNPSMPLSQLRLGQRRSDRPRSPAARSGYAAAEKVLQPPKPVPRRFCVDEQGRATVLRPACRSARPRSRLAPSGKVFSCCGIGIGADSRVPSSSYATASCWRLCAMRLGRTSASARQTPQGRPHRPRRRIMIVLPGHLNLKFRTDPSASPCRVGNRVNDVLARDQPRRPHLCAFTGNPSRPKAVFRRQPASSAGPAAYPPVDAHSRDLSVRLHPPEAACDGEAALPPMAASPGAARSALRGAPAGGSISGLALRKT